ncbi:MAG: Ycf66 family protein [Cyanobacteria bacterium P01_D01_bin.6]
MLAYILAIAVAIGSFSFYMAAFFVPEMHRRQDFFWSGLGLFYAVVLWFCAGRLTGAVLLGQLVSVALLGGLGWHTLELRRELTPELVQTPVSWEDIQKLLQGLQLQIQKYIRLDDWTRRWQSGWHTVSGAVANWRDRATQSSTVEAAAEVPPLKRSPAYEFETATGDGQAVPSEFATVASHPQLNRETSEIASASDLDAETAVPETIDSGTTDTTTVKSANVAVSVTTADEQIEPAPPAGADSADELSAATAQLLEPPLQPPARESQETVTAPPQTPSKSPTAVPPQTASQPVSNQRQSPLSKPQPVAGAFGWLSTAVSKRRQPKSQRQVIEIPPRPPSIPREAAANDGTRSRPTSSTPKKRASTKSQRSVIEIPPRPPSIPRPRVASPTSPPTSQPPPSQATTDDDANWVDMGDAFPTAEINRAEPGPAPASREKPEAPIPETNWPDTETNWPQQGDDLTMTNIPEEPTHSASAARNDTNWPDDEDTNWPDESSTR